MYRAVREYSRWRPIRRQIGTGILTADVLAGATSLVIIGGPWAVGDVLTLDQFNLHEETVTVTAVQVTSDSSDGVGVYTTVTVTPTAYAHAAAAFVIRSVTGITMVANMMQYALPYDFISLDLESMDLSTGTRSAVQKYERFNDAVRVFSDMIGGVGYGMSQTFSGTGYIGSFMAFASGPGVSIEPGNGTAYQMYYELTPGTPPYITFNPQLSEGTILDPLYYQGQHIPVTVPDYDMDALVSFCVWQAIRARITGLQLVGQVQDGRRSMNTSYGVKELNATAKAAQDDWEDRIVNRPFATSG